MSRLLLIAGTFSVYCIGLAIMVWALAYPEIGIARLGNRKELLIFAGLLVGLGAIGAASASGFIRLERFGKYGLFILPILAAVNIVMAPNQLGGRNYMISSKPSAILSEIALNSPNGKIRTIRQPYYVLRHVYRGRDYRMMSGAPLVKSSLLTISAAKNVTSANFSASEWEASIKSAKAQPILETLELPQDQRLHIIDADGPTIMIVQDPELQDSWYAIAVE